MFHNRQNPNKFSRAYLYAVIVNGEGEEFYYFTARDVDFDRKKIKGKYYYHGEWLTKEFDFPDVIINTANQKTSYQDMVENKLRELVPFTSYPVGAKTDVYNRIKRGKVFTKNLIPYRRLLKGEDAFEFIDLYQKIIIKPIRGHHGENLIAIEKVDDQYIMTSGLRKINYPKTQLASYLNNLIAEKKMVIQKYVNSRLKSNEPLDFRLHMQKDKTGKWQITAIIPRIGSIRKVVTNLSQGSQLTEIDIFLLNEFQKEGPIIRKKLEKFALDFANHFDSLYPYKFDEIGIDVGLDENRDIWIYEVNWRPGHVFIEVQTAKRAIEYAIYLGKQKRMSNNEKN